VKGLADVHVQFIGLQQNRQHDVINLEDIGHNLLIEDSTSTNHKGSSPFSREGKF
jgi:ribosomal protein S11